MIPFNLSIMPEFNIKLTEEQLSILRPLDSQYTYNDQIKEELIKMVGREVEEEEKKVISRYVYIGRENIRKEKEEQYKQDMLKNGWIELNEDVVFNGETYGLMKPNARSRGYSLRQFDRAFCQLI